MNIFTRLRLKKHMNPSGGGKLLCPGCYGSRMKFYEDVNPYMVRFICKDCGMKTIYDRRDMDTFEADKFGFIPKYKDALARHWAMRERNKARIEAQQQKRRQIFS